METNKILSHKPRVLTQAQRQAYFDDGFSDEEAAALDFSKVGWMAGKAGTVMVHIQFEANNCILPPDWSGGYTSIFDLQQSSDLEK